MASAKVVTFGRATAKLYADIALKNQVSDLRGYMFNAGLRRIRVTKQASSCAVLKPGLVIGGLYECTSRIQLCGQ